MLYCQPAHRLQTQVSDIRLRTCDKDGENFGEVIHQFRVELLVIMNHDVDRLEEKPIFNIIFID